MNTPNFSSQVLSDNGAFEDLVQEQIQAKQREKEIDPDFKFFVEAGFHRGNIQQIKKALGSKCTFLAHEQSKGKYFIKAVMKNELGGKDTVRFSLGGTPEQMTENDYQELFNQLKDGNYVGR